MNYFQTGIKLCIGIAYAILIMRLSGRKTLSPLSSFDQINNYILGGIIGGVLFNKNIEVIEFIFVLTLWGVITLMINYSRKKSKIIKVLIDGSPIVLIEDGKVVRVGIEQANITIQDLYLKLKIQGIYNIKGVGLGTLEQNGSVTVLKKANYNTQPIPLVIDKIIYKENLELVEMDELLLKERLRDIGINDLDKVAAVEFYQENLRVVDFI